MHTQKVSKAAKLPKTTQLKFVLTNQQTFANLDALKLANYEKFVKIPEVGKKIESAINDESKQELQKLIDDNFMLIPFLKMYIDEGFVQALHLKLDNIVLYFLENGYDVANCEGTLISVCYSLQYLKNDAPIQLFQMLLEYGAQSNEAESTQSQTPLHIAAKYGSEPFARLLIEYGADKDAVDDNKKTPLNYAIEGKHEAVTKYLRDLGAKDYWRY